MPVHRQLEPRRGGGNGVRRPYPVAGFLLGAYPELPNYEEGADMQPPPPVGVQPLPPAFPPPPPHQQLARFRPASPARPHFAQPQPQYAQPQPQHMRPDALFAAPYAYQPAPPAVWPGYYHAMGPAYGQVPQHPPGLVQLGVGPPVPAHLGMPAVPQPRPLPPAARERPTRLTVSVPLNSEVPGAVQSRTEFTVPADIDFPDLRDRCCAKMDIAVATAILGYKVPGDLRRAPAHRYSNKDEHRGAIDKVIQLMTRARTRVIVLEIYNLSATANPDKTGKKKKNAPTNMPVQDMATLRALKIRLECMRHRNRWCFVLPNGEHVELDIALLTLWAKYIDLGQATFDSLPNLAAFDRLRKKPRATSTISQSSSAPIVHVHLSENLLSLATTPSSSSSLTTTSSGSPSLVIPTLAPLPGPFISPPSAVVSTDVGPSPFQSGTAPIADGISYPTTMDIVQELERTHPAQNFSNFRELLEESRLTDARRIAHASETYLRDILDMSPGQIETLLDCAKAVMRRTQKLRSSSADEDCTPFIEMSDSESDDEIEFV